MQQCSCSVARCSCSVARRLLHQPFMMLSCYVCAYEYMIDSKLTSSQLLNDGIILNAFGSLPAV
jgi:hypothetical protein